MSGNAADMVQIIGTSDALRLANSAPWNHSDSSLFLEATLLGGFHFDVSRIAGIWTPLSADVINPLRWEERFPLKVFLLASVHQVTFQTGGSSFWFLKGVGR